MSLIVKPDANDLYRMLEASGREDNFSRKGCEVIIDYFDEMGEDVEADVVQLCCEYAESTYDELFDEVRHYIESFETWLEYNEDGDESDYEEYRDELMLEYLNNHTTVLGTFGNSVVYAVF